MIFKHFYNRVIIIIQINLLHKYKLIFILNSDVKICYVDFIKDAYLNKKYFCIIIKT